MRRPRGKSFDDPIVHWLAGLAVSLEGTWLILRGIPEVLPFGEELGVVVSQVSMSYIAAYIFRYLVVVRPDNRTRRRAIATQWTTLSLIANDGLDLINDFEVIARVTAERPVDDDYIEKLCRNTEWNAAVCMFKRLDATKDRWQTLTASFYLFDPELVLILREVRQSEIFTRLNPDVFEPGARSNDLDYYRERTYIHGPNGAQRMTMSTVGPAISEYYRSTQKLRSYIDGARKDDDYVDGLIEHWSTQPIASANRSNFRTIDEVDREAI